MGNKHYLLNKYRYVMQQQEKMSPGSMEELLETEYRNLLASSSTVVIDFYIHPFSQMSSTLSKMAFQKSKERLFS